MSRLHAVARYWLPLPLKLDANFWCMGSRVFTAGSMAPSSQAIVTASESPEGVLPDNGYLCFEVYSTVHAIDSGSEAARYARPRYLALLSLVSFLSRHPFTVFDCVGSMSSKEEAGGGAAENGVDVCRFVMGEEDLSNSAYALVTLLDETDSNRGRLLASLLDRWRKALYLRTENEGLLLGEECFLAYFHVLELISSVYRKEQDAEVRTKLRAFLQDVLSEPLEFSGQGLGNLVEEKSKAVRPMLTGGAIPVGSRICYMLRKVGLLDEAARTLVQKVVRTRNEIAHGRQVFQEEMLWPLSSFFPLDVDLNDHLGFIAILSARTISCWAGIDAWKDEWERIRPYLTPSAEVVGNFLRRVKRGDKTAKLEAVRLGAIGRYWFRNCSRWELGSLEKASTLVGLSSRLEDEQDLWGTFVAAVFLSDSADEQVRERWRSAVRSLHDGDLVGYSNVKDVLREVENRGHRPVWLREWIEAGGHLGRGSATESDKQ